MASPVSTASGATNFGIGEDRPNGLADHNGTLYMVGWRKDKLATLNLTSGIASFVRASTIEFNVGESTPEGLASVNNMLYLATGTLNRLDLLDLTTGGRVSGANGPGGWGISENDARGLTGRDSDDSDDNDTNDKMYMIATGPGALYEVVVNNAGTGNHGRATRIGASPGSDNFGVSEGSPYGLAFIGQTLYMMGRDTDKLYELAYDRDPYGRMSQQ